MRRPPPLSQLGRFPASGGICILALAVTLADLKWDTTPLQMSYLAFWSEPWRLVGSVLPHANAIHLAGNLYWVWVFGTLIELEFGSLRTALLMLVLAIGSSAAEYAFGIGGIGLSGVGYGLFGFLWMASRLQPRLRDAMDPATTKLFIIWFFFCIFTTWTHVWLIANVAHGAGAVFGAVAGGLAAAKPRIRMTAAMLLGLSLAGVLCAASIWRPLINNDPEAHLDLENAGISAIQYGNNRKAVGLLQAATSYRHAEGRTWYNLGVAYRNLNELQKAERAFTKSVELNPSGKSDGGNSLDWLGYIAASRGQHERAIGLYRRAIKAGHSDAESWSSLGTELREVGRDDEAAEAFRHASAETRPSANGEAAATRTQISEVMMYIACTVGESTIFGKGLFATEPVPKGKIICFFSTGAAVITEAEFLEAVRTDNHAIIRTGTRHAGKFFTHGNAQEPYTFLNHSFAPNLLCHCGMVLARRDIAANEELTIDYRSLIDDTDLAIYSDAATGREIRGFSARETLLRTARELIEILEGTDGWMG